MRRAASPSGFTIIEILIVMALIGVVSSLAVIGVGHARVRAAETAALASLHTINQAQFAYMQACGNQAYAPTLVSLGTPPPGSDSAFLSPDLTQSDPLQKSWKSITPLPILRTRVIAASDRSARTRIASSMEMSRPSRATCRNRAPRATAWKFAEP